MTNLLFREVELKEIEEGLPVSNQEIIVWWMLGDCVYDHAVEQFK